MAGLVQPPAMASYSVVKAGVVALSETLLHELAPYGVGVSVICPSFFRTNLPGSMRGSDPAMERGAAGLVNKSRYDADTIAARAVQALDRGTYLILTHREGRLAYRGKRFTPRLYHRSMKQAGRQLAAKTTRGDAPRAATPEHG
jgi:NAD(P)-dependent dehydrogenase (short-subunit alcohol dehydrogenase family)